MQSLLLSRAEPWELGARKAVRLSPRVRRGALTSIFYQTSRKRRNSLYFNDAEIKQIRKLRYAMKIFHIIVPRTTAWQTGWRIDRLTNRTLAAGSSSSSCSWFLNSASCLDNTFLSSMRFSSVCLAWPTLTRTSTSWPNQDYEKRQNLSFCKPKFSKRTHLVESVTSRFSIYFGCLLFDRERRSLIPSFWSENVHSELRCYHR